MFKHIEILKQKNYKPTIIFDIGAYHGLWTKNMLSIYPESKYYLYEAIDYNELNKITNTNIIKFNTILNDKVGLVDWYEMRNTGDSMFKENTIYFENCNPIKKLSIDLNTHIKNNNIKILDTDNIFIKIDSQGAEIPILKGSTDILQYTDFILLEIPLFGQYNKGVPNFLEHIIYMQSIDFIPYDIVDSHYIDNFNRQIDMLFINSKSNFYNNII